MQVHFLPAARRSDRAQQIRNAARSPSFPSGCARRLSMYSLYLIPAPVSIGIMGGERFIVIVDQLNQSAPHWQAHHVDRSRA